MIKAADFKINDFGKRVLPFRMPTWVPACCITLFVWTASRAALAEELRLVYHGIRQDRSTVSPETWQWNEGWPEIRQFFPRYFKPAGTLHLFVRNAGDGEVDVTQIEFNGRPIDEVCTRPDYAGPVIWYRSNPERLRPGQTGMIYVRLRDAPDGPITLGVTTESGQRVSARFDQSDRDQIRFGYVGFSQKIDRLYAYVENWTDREFTLRRVQLDGRDVTDQCELINANFAAGPALVELSLADPLSYGDFHCLEATTREGPVAISQIRARDAQYRLGVWVSGVTKCYSKFFNVSYMPNSFQREPGWWDPNTEENKLGFSTTGVADDADQIRYMATLPADRFLYTNMDEPDAHEPGPLPYMSRCGINIMQKVEPVMRLQRRLDPRHHTTFVCNRTYAPLNWLCYGEVPDLFISDCYVPCRWMGYDLTCVPMQMRAMAAAAAPRPSDMMIWGCMNTGHQMKRSPTPQENDMVVHYAMAEGAKGLYYFCDWNSYPVLFEGGHFIGVSSTNMQWENIGRMNAEITRIAPLLSKGHPFQIAESDNDQLYVRSLLCGKDNFVVVMVNRSHRIHGPTNNKGAMQPFIFPVDEATVRMDIPPWFQVRSAAHVTWDGARPVELEMSSDSRTASLTVQDLMTSKVLVLSQNADIAPQLTVSPEQFAAMLESEVPTYVTKNPPIADVTRPDAVITLDAAAVKEGNLVLDLTRPDSLGRASSIATTGELRQVPGEWLGLFTPANWHGESSIVFCIESPVPLTQIQAVLESRTPNITACAHNAVGISLEGTYFTEDVSFKMPWPGYGELTVKMDADEGEPIHRFYARVLLRDPGIVYSDEATNLAQILTISWTRP